MKGGISHNLFTQLTDLLPVNSILFFNNTKVIPARLLFEKSTGARVELFLLNPGGSDPLLERALAATGETVWKCAVGNMKRWKDGIQLNRHLGTVILTADWHDRRAGTVRFAWSPRDMAFSEIIRTLGATPLPPYIKRAAEPEDRDRYQTIYSKLEGAVAAPTAGLHFTKAVLEKLDAAGIQRDFLTLHVSAGTFLPVKENNAADHVMHEEQVIIRKQNIINLLQPGKKVIAVGTTALRTLESLYWYGAILLRDESAPFAISQSVPHDFSSPPPAADALNKILDIMEKHGVEQLNGNTSLYVMPGYRFRLVHGLITNFHQPGSTLLLLIAAFVGPDWKKIYQEALEKQYRFLSYGDSSLLLPSNGLTL